MSERRDSEFSPYKLAFCSAFGCWLGDMLVYPIDTIATRIKANRKIFRSFLEELNYVFKKEDFRSLYRGFTSTFSCAFVPNIIYFFIYEKLNKLCIEHLRNQKQNHPHFEKFKYALPMFTSPFAELVSLLTYLPFDIVRTRLQVNVKEYNYKSITEGMRDIVEKEGILRIYQSSPLYLMESCFYAAIQMWLYEMMRSYILMNYHTNSQKGLTIVESLLTSITVTTAATVLVNPVDVLFTRYQIVDSNVEQLSIKGLIKDLIKNEGMKGFMKGTGAKVLGNVAIAMIWLPIYDYFKTKYGVAFHD